MRGRTLIVQSDPEARERRLAGGLFFATCASVFIVYLISWGGGPWESLQFAAALMGILLAHELGHYAVARYHGFALSLPRFLPAPFWIGTLGAVIHLRDQPKTRAGLLEMGAAGPIAGLGVVFFVAMVRFLGADPAPAADSVQLSCPALLAILGWCVTGSVPVISSSDPLLFAAWIGCLVTAMNLIPYGQLDGGHIFIAAFPDWARAMRWGVPGALIVGGFFWVGWWAWLVLLVAMGARHPIEIRKPEPHIDGRAWGLAAAALVCWLLTLTVAPFPFSP